MLFFITNSSFSASNSTAVPPPTIATSVLTTPAPLPSHFLKLKLGVAANKFNQTLFLEEFGKYLSFDPAVVVIGPTVLSEMEITVYIRNDTMLTSVFIDNFITVWNDKKTRARIFKQTANSQVRGVEAINEL